MIITVLVNDQYEADFEFEDGEPKPMFVGLHSIGATDSGRDSLVTDDEFRATQIVGGQGEFDSIVRKAINRRDDAEREGAEFEDGTEDDDDV